MVSSLAMCVVRVLLERNLMSSGRRLSRRSLGGCTSSGDSNCIDIVAGSSPAPSNILVFVFA